MNELHDRVVGAVEDFGLAVTVHDHANLDCPVDSPKDLSDALGISLDRITKSVLLKQQSSNKFVLAVCPVNKKIDMKAISIHCEMGRMEVAGPGALTKNLGYQRLGVSPLGLPNHILVVIDKSLLTHRTVLVGGGNAGIEVELNPEDLAQVCDAEIVEIADG
ncbi:YbaK/EbsC family protein [Rhodococcus sp. ARC_M6]|uniref:aminoacyl-tRNA deacylase n=1 Tax=Rhodococcus sp. ARC_M6 TaxID=2928852 RepID=UPI001FB1D82D|nr:YbaK/EbsC family protein [Rhodococcus sp. ARC_M6]MCJ0904293.1 hypothetical protein [Rhodococcus sp. ARC_M6]